MPPKKKAVEPSKKAETKKKEKIIEDKTFGLKNKKGAKTQKFIQQVQHQVKHGNQSAKKVETTKLGPTGKKEDKKKELEDLNQLFRPVMAQKVEKGTDPKSVLCAFYKQGQCTKGDKCKFSHDVTIERKSEKRNIYVDVRDDEDNMESWDEDKLKEVVEKKHGETEKKMPKTDIICKFFLDALESNKYGWFWECPNGNSKCHYRHALPAGFVLKKNQKKEEKKEEISLEDLIERERAKLGCVLTKITLETFLAWKKKKLKEKQDELNKENERKKAEFKAGRHVGLSGRDMFTFKPEMAEEDDMDEGEAAFDMREREDEEDEVTQNGTLKEITLEQLSDLAKEADGTGTVAVERYWEHEETQKDEAGAAAAGDATPNEDDYEEEAAVPIDEHLFEDDDEDLDELEENLQRLDVEG